MSAFATIMVAVAGSSVITAIVTGIASFSVNRASAGKLRTERDNLMAEAAKKWQGIADEAATKALTQVQAQCDACERRLEVAEKRQLLAEERQRAAEERLHTVEEREQQTRSVLRTVVRANDTADPMAIDTAITAARELL